MKIPFPRLNYAKPLVEEKHMRLGQRLILAIAMNCTSAMASDALYIYGTPNGCLVQLKTPLKANEHVQWHGDCNSEFASGAGVLIVLDDSGKTHSALRMTMQKGIQSGSAVPVANPSAYQSNESGFKRTAQSAPQAPYTQDRCSKELMTKVEEQGNGVVTVKRYRVQTTSPLHIEITHGQTYLQDLNIPGVPRKQAGQFDWFSSNTYGRSEASSIVDKSGEEISRFSTCSSNNFCATSVTALEQERDWHQCLLKAANSTGGPAAQGDMDTITPQVPGCPKYLRKSLVTWHQVGNPQLNTWEIRNISDRHLKVTFADDGINSDSPTLNPGETAQVGLTGQRVPRYVVRDFDELTNFNRTPEGRGGKTLKCQLAIRPR